MPRIITVRMTVIVDDNPPEEVVVTWQNHENSRIPTNWPATTATMLRRHLHQTSLDHQLRVTPGPPRPLARTRGSLERDQAVAGSARFRQRVPSNTEAAPQDRGTSRAGEDRTGGLV